MVCDSIEGFGFPKFGESCLIICAVALHVDRAKLLVVEGTVAKLSFYARAKSQQLPGELCSVPLSASLATLLVLSDNEFQASAGKDVSAHSPPRRSGRRTCHPHAGRPGTQ